MLNESKKAETKNNNVHNETFEMFYISNRLRYVSYTFVLLDFFKTVFPQLFTMSASLSN